MGTYLVTGYDLGKESHTFVVLAYNMFHAKEKARSLVDFVVWVEVK